MRPAGPAERARLNETFAELCRIASPFGHERACAQHVARELRALGLEVEEDDAAQRAGAECGNLLAHIPAPGGPRPGVLLCAHLDTVAHDAPIEPVLVDDGWENAHPAILGADNKTAVAVILEVARRLRGADGALPEPAAVDVELLFTVAEEDALAGAKALDAGRLRSRFGYVFDQASPIGGIVLASPTAFRLQAELQGQAAHAGVRPEDGRSAILAAARAVDRMPHGRLDAETTANVSSIAGGGPSTNVVPATCRVVAEARSLDPARVEAVVGEMVDALHDGADALQADVDVEVEQRFRGYRTRPGHPMVLAAERALTACGYAPRPITTGGGSDANALIAAGLDCLNLANGTERNHEPTERVAVAALEGMLDVALALVDTAAETLTT